MTPTVVRSKEDKRKEKLTAAKKTKIKAFLRAHGHEKDKDKIIAATIADTNELIDLLCDLYGLDRARIYEPATAG